MQVHLRNLHKARFEAELQRVGFSHVRITDMNGILARRDLERVLIENSWELDTLPRNPQYPALLIEARK